MSLYDGTDLDRKVKSGDPNGSGWNTGLKLLQTQIQLKKASAFTPSTGKRERGGSAATSLVSEPVSKKKDKANVILSSNLPFIAPPESPFDEFNFEDEYNPLYPNDYEKIMARRDEEKRRKREEERRKEAEERYKRKQQELLNRDEEDEWDPDDRHREFEKRTMGAAIAPPASLVYEQASSEVVSSTVQVDELPGRPNYQPSFGAGSRGLNVAAKIMEKYGYRHGGGLGKSEQGMSTALHVEKTSLRGGKIIHEKDVSTAKNEPANQEPASESITEILKCPTKVVLLKNVVGPGEVDEDLEPEMKEEMLKYGEVVSVVIFEMPGQPEDEAVRIFVEFSKVDQAIKAVVSIHGRFFAGRSIKAGFYDLEKFKQYQLAE